MRFFSKHIAGILTKLLVQQNSDVAPTDCIEISEEAFKALSVTQTLADLKASACSMVDQKAGEVRQRFITAVPGQSETYLLKAEEAKAVIALNYQITISNYPMIQAEMSATGIQDVPTICNGIVQTELQWRFIAAQIEQERRGGKISIMNAADETYVVVERDNALEALNQIGI